jgi:hypothetical protein
VCPYGILRARPYNKSNSKKTLEFELFPESIILTGEEIAHLFNANKSMLATARYLGASQAFVS